MTDPAAFRACYSDWKLIKTRGVIQVILEVPLHESDAAYRVLGGMPEAATERWFAVARLQAEKPSEKPNKRLVTQAAIACTDDMFQTFLMVEHNCKWKSENAAAEFVRDWCNVISRSEILLGTPAAEKWDKLWTKFLLWKQD